MTHNRTRYLVQRANRRAGERFYWMPSRELKAEGWRAIALRHASGAWMDRFDAGRAAEEINAWLDAWYAGEKPMPAFAGARPYAVAQAPAAGRGGVRHGPGSLGALAAAYKASGAFQSRAERTQQDYAKQIDILIDWLGDAPAAALTKEAVEAKHAALAARSPRQAGYFVQVLRIVLNWGRHRQGYDLHINVAERIRIRTAGSGNRIIWPTAAIADFTAAADRLGLHAIGTAIALNHWIGQRVSDLLAIPRLQYRDGELVLWQGKTKAGVAVPIGDIPSVKTRIEAELARQKSAGVIGRTLILDLEAGAPYSYHRFRHQFDQVREAVAAETPIYRLDYMRRGQDVPDELAAGELVMRFLRHTAVVRLAESGATDEMIAAITGHSLREVKAILDVYLVRTRELARQALQLRAVHEQGRSAQGGEG